ncbi:MAG: hypothetical protein E6R03_03410 [Hyphomicrobiaceae bacterium]|nr:MAG: hypothetical protein E6R03_03410 [Hyphomicrobiaceae bacterium]
MMHVLKRIAVPGEHKLITSIEVGQTARRNYAYRVLWKGGPPSMWFEGFPTSDSAEKAGLAWV